MINLKNVKKINETKKDSGITLIALVVTIIVLLILAGISIMMLTGNNGILQRATDAKISSEKSDAKEQARMDIMAWITEKTAHHEDASLDDTKVKEILTGKSYVKTANDTSFITAEEEYEIPYSELYQSNSSTNNDDDTPADTEYPYRTPYIPTNFSHVGSENWNQGFTIKGDAGTANENDEFVWVPCVLDQSTVKEGDTVQTFEKITTGNYNSGLTLHPTGGTNAEVDDEDSTVGEIRTSVGTYGGFYIAKYEAGIAGDKSNDIFSGITATDGSVKPLSQAGKGVWNFITRENCLTVSKAMIPSSIGAKSTLISGECWDTTLAWITATADSAYAEDSSGKGYYEDVSSGEVHTTGYYGTNTNNIFDMGGNVWEYTSENGMRTAWGQSRQYVVFRGGYQGSYAFIDSASCRSNWGDIYSDADKNYGFRVVLYKISNF